MNVLIDDWLDDIMPHVPGALEPLVKQEILAAVREFCDGGRAWVYNFQGESTTKDSPVLPLSNMPEDTALGYVLRIAFEQNTSYPRYLKSISTPILSRKRESSSPLVYYMETPTTIHVAPVPTQDLDNKYEVEATLLPIKDTVKLPDEFRTHWADAITDGTLYRMMRQISKPWSSATAAAFYGRSFRNYIRRVRAVTDARYSTGASIWTYPDFASKIIGGV